MSSNHRNESSDNSLGRGGAGPTDISSYLNYTPNNQRPPRPPSPPPPPPPQAQPASRAVQTASLNSPAVPQREDDADLADQEDCCRVYARQHLMIWGFVGLVAYLTPTIWILASNRPDFMIAFKPIYSPVIKAGTQKISIGLKTCTESYNADGDLTCTWRPISQNWGYSEGPCQYSDLVTEITAYRQTYTTPASILSSIGFVLLLGGALFCRLGWRLNIFSHIVIGFLMGLLSFTALLAATVIASKPTTAGEGSFFNFLNACGGWFPSSVPALLIGCPAGLLFFSLLCGPAVALDAARKEIKRRIARAEISDALDGEGTTLLS